MGDLKFSCEHCEQSLVVDLSGAGGTTTCPHCANTIGIPGTPAKALEEARALQQTLQTVAAELQELREAFAATENEGARSKSLLTDAIQELRKTRAVIAERDAQLEALAASEQSATEQRALAQSRHEADHANRERDSLLLHVEAIQSGLAAAQIDIAALRRERKETLFKLSATEKTLGESSRRAATAEAEIINLKNRAEALGAQFAETSQALFAEQAKCAQLAADLQLKPEVAHFVEVREAGNKWRDQLQQLEEIVAQAREDLTATQAEREAFRKQKLQAELKLAATRDALDDHHLQEENEVLKALVDRLNNELKGAGHVRRLSSSTEPSLVGSMSEFKRWLVSRAFIPET